MIKFRALLKGFTMRTFTGAHCFFQIFTTMNSIFFFEIWHAHVKMRKKWSLILIGFFFTRAMESTQTFYTLNKVNLANFYNICFFHRQNPKILRNLIFSSTGPLEGVVHSREPDSRFTVHTLHLGCIFISVQQLG